MYFKLLLVFSIIFVTRAGTGEIAQLPSIHCVYCKVTWNSVCPYGPFITCGSFAEGAVLMCVHYKHTTANGQSFLIKGCGFGNTDENKTACERQASYVPNSTECQQCATPFCNYKSDRYTYL